MIEMMTRGPLLLCLALMIASLPAHARRLRPAIRHRHELRHGRFELGPSVGISLDRSLRHALLLGLKLEYHLNDWLSLGLDAGYGIGIDTGLTGELHRRYEGDPERWRELTDRFSDLRAAGDLRVTLTPISGKLGLFSRLFIAYDLYAFAGLGLALLSNRFSGPSAEDQVSEGPRAGPAFGLGMHLFLTRFIAMGVEIRDLVFLDNESGQDLTRGLSESELSSGEVTIDADDQTLSSHWFVGINLTLFLPTSIRISP
jgi:outer membrane beta-barrel protein